MVEFKRPQVVWWQRQPASLRLWPPRPPLPTSAPVQHPSSLPASRTSPHQAPGLPCPSRPPNTSALAASSCYSPAPCMLSFRGSVYRMRQAPPGWAPRPQVRSLCQPQAREQRAVCVKPRRAREARPECLRAVTAEALLAVGQGRPQPPGHQDAARWSPPPANVPSQCLGLLAREIWGPG